MATESVTPCWSATRRVLPLKCYIPGRGEKQLGYKKQLLYDSRFQSVVKQKLVQLRRWILLLQGKKNKTNTHKTNTSMCPCSLLAHDFSTAVFIDGCKHREGSVAGCFTLLVILLILLNIFLGFIQFIYFLLKRGFPS